MYAECGLKYFRQIKNGTGGTWQDGGVQPGCSEAVEGQQVLTDLGVPPDVRAKGYLRRVYEGPPYNYDLFVCTCPSKSHV